ncbi:hypothetical protein GCM10011405_36930 [Rufibacter glacialis]|nr:Ig-like domain-containing protein [Rufibacter glacialis]GGK85703.1 hypothetical protein GCM10011405_36930 [Rufibacter glacialis]
MGTAYYRPLAQWSNGEYLSANNKEDDVVRIGTLNGFGFRPDDHGDVSSTATSLTVDTNGNVSGAATKGIITTRNDVDVFSFKTGNGVMALTVTPNPDYPNLDVLLTLRDGSGNVIATADPSSMSASLNVTLTTGMYFLTIDGTKGNLGADSDYSSLGEYTISGTTPINQPPVVALTSPADGATFTAPASLILAAQASDDGGIVRVEFFQGTTKLGEDTDAPYSFTWSGVAAGTYSLSAKAIDHGGLTTGSTAVQVTVNASAIACENTGSITREYWAEVAGTSISDIPLGTPPTSTSQLPSFEAPSYVADNYAQRLRGFLCVPATGEYTFYLAGDDQCELWLGTGADPASRQRIAFVSEWNHPREWEKYASQRAATLTLQANTRYYLEALHKEAGGGDNLAVGWLTPGSSAIEVIPGSNLAPFHSPGNQLPIVALTSPSQGATFNVPASITLAAEASDPDGTIAKVEFFQGTSKLGEDTMAPYTIDWLVNTTGTHALMARATDNLGHTKDSEVIWVNTVNPSYCIPDYAFIGCNYLTIINNFSFHTLANNGSGCSNGTAVAYTIYTPTGSLTTTVNQGQSYPISLQAGTEHPQSFGVWIDFNQDKDFDDAGEFVYASPTSSKDQYTATISIPTSATLGATRMRVRSKYDGTFTNTESCSSALYGEAEDYTITIAPALPTVACENTGSITREYWADVAGTSISDIPLGTAPTSTGQLSSLEAPSYVADNYAQRLRGFLCVPATGEYTFYLAGDDQCELWLGTGPDPASRQRIAFVSEWTHPREWEKYASQRSVSVTLQANTKYYIEALHKEAGGGDNLAVGWLTPGSSAIEVIPGSNLAPFHSPGNQPPTVALTSFASKATSLGTGKTFISHPNPFSDKVTFQFPLKKDEEYALKIYHVNGTLVKNLTSGKAKANSLTEVDWTDEKIPAGVYLARLISANRIQTIRVIRQ